MPTIQAWISKLIDPDAQHVPGDPTQHFDHQAQYMTQQPLHYPGQPAGLPPPLPMSPNSPPSNGALLNMNPPVSLALVNQIAMQRGYAVTYPAEQAGPPHQPIWTVRCCSKSDIVGSTGRLITYYSEWARTRTWYGQKPKDCEGRSSSKCMGGDGMVIP